VTNEEMTPKAHKQPFLIPVYYLCMRCTMFLVKWDNII